MWTAAFRSQTESPIATWPGGQASATACPSPALWPRLGLGVPLGPGNGTPHPYGPHIIPLQACADTVVRFSSRLFLCPFQSSRLAALSPNHTAVSVTLTGLVHGEGTRACASGRRGCWGHVPRSREQCSLSDLWYPQLAQGGHGASCRSTEAKAGRLRPKSARGQLRTEPPPTPGPGAAEAAASAHSECVEGGSAQRGQRMETHRESTVTHPDTLETSPSRVLCPHGPPSQADGRSSGQCHTLPQANLKFRCNEVPRPPHL